MDQFLVDDRPPGQQTTIGDIAGAWGSNGCPHCQHGRGRGRLRPSRLSAAVTGLDAVFSGAGTLDDWPRIRNTLPACSRALAQNQNGIRSWHQNQNQNQNQTQNDACMAATLKPCEPAGGLLARPPRRAPLFSLPGRSTPALSAREGMHGLPRFWLRDNYWLTMRSSLRTTATM